MEKMIDNEIISFSIFFQGINLSNLNWLTSKSIEYFNEIGLQLEYFNLSNSKNINEYSFSSFMNNCKK